MPLIRAARYASVTARCRTMRSRLIGREAFDDLAASRSIGELYAALGTTHYAPFLTTVSGEGIQRAVAESFAYRRDGVIRMLKKGDRELFSLFFVRKYALLEEKAAQSHAPHPEELFRAVDRAYLESLKRSMRHLASAERRRLKRMIGSYIDLLNLYNLVKLRLLYRQRVEETLTYMLPYGERLTIGKLADFCRADDLGQLSQRVEPLLGVRFDTYETFRKALYGYHREQLLAAWSGYPFSVAQSFSLLRLLELEAADLNAVTEGVRSGLGRDAIAAMRVGG